MGFLLEKTKTYSLSKWIMGEIGPDLLKPITSQNQGFNKVISSLEEDIRLNAGLEFLIFVIYCYTQGTVRKEVERAGANMKPDSDKFQRSLEKVNLHSGLLNSAIYELLGNKFKILIAKKRGVDPATAALSSVDYNETFHKNNLQTWGNLIRKRVDEYAEMENQYLKSGGIKNEEEKTSTLSHNFGVEVLFNIFDKEILEKHSVIQGDLPIQLRSFLVMFWLTTIYGNVEIKNLSQKFDVSFAKQIHKKIK